LEQVGVRFEDNDTLHLLDSAGARIDWKRRVARLPEHLVMDAVKSVRKRFTIRPRSPRFSVEVGSGRLRCSMGSQLYLIEPLARRRRLGVSEDIVRGCIVGDALDNISIVSPIVVPHDVPPKLSEVVAYQLGLKHTTKHLFLYITQGSSAPYLVAMASAVFGGLKGLAKNRGLIYLANPITPLRYTQETLRLINYFAGLGLPIYFNSMPQAGLTAPITLAGSIALGNAEILAGITVAHLHRKGLPILYANTPHTADMRRGDILFGAPEQALLCLGAVQLAHYYGFPATVNAGLTDSKLPDAQAGFEKALTTLVALWAGAEGIGAQGILGADQGACLEQLVLDDEFIGAALRVMEGLAVTPEELAGRVVNEVGVGGLFLAHPHTLSRARSALWCPKLFDREGWERWLQAGGRDSLQRAHSRVESILKEHLPEPLDRDVEREVDRIADRARRELLGGTKTL
jgi:trimethylamine--corrinoid protein Co-methyltransferase